MRVTRKAQDLESWAFGQKESPEQVPSLETEKARKIGPFQVLIKA